MGDQQRPKINRSLENEADLAALQYWAAIGKQAISQEKFEQVGVRGGGVLSRPVYNPCPMLIRDNSGRILPLPRKQYASHPRSIKSTSLYEHRIACRSDCCPPLSYPKDNKPTRTHMACLDELDGKLATLREDLKKTDLNSIFVEDVMDLLIWMLRQNPRLRATA